MEDESWVNGWYEGFLEVYFMDLVVNVDKNVGNRGFFFW